MVSELPRDRGAGGGQGGGASRGHQVLPPPTASQDRRFGLLWGAPGTFMSHHCLMKIVMGKGRSQDSQVTDKIWTKVRTRVSSPATSCLPSRTALPHPPPIL